MLATPVANQAAQQISKKTLWQRWVTREYAGAFIGS